ncbi:MULTISPECIES: AAA family ATPase [Saccharothrix]|uniref:AAA family ATPase n=1 Tax=Saccharothrix TaxID=2071 RepID=UPI00093C8532|nr:histone-like nucleoid-structuring protein Lsr2 [Saccharothrix sp. CB00851]OKI19811.1 hypothetical protein A6A25_38650 [Saccharothrix sp. CB00851]
MRVRRLTLDSYGAFHNRTIELGTGLSVVLGPNETGKTTALDALADLLWSIPQSSKRAFHYRRQELAISAVLVLPDGTEIPVERRASGMIDTATGAEVPVLWQGDGDDRGRWRTSFGLSHEELRKGGEYLFKGEGDLASLIFRARSGQSVHHLLDSLSARADSLYKEHRGNKGVRARRAIAEYEQAVHDVEEATALAADVTAIREVLRQVGEDVERARRVKDAAFTEMAGQQARLRVIGRIRLLAQAEGRISALRSAGPCLDADDLALHGETAERLHRAEGEIVGVEGEIAATSAQLADTASEDPILEDRSLVERLQRESTARLDDAEQARACLADADESDASTRALLVELTGNVDQPVDVLLNTLWVGEDRVSELDAAAEALVQADAVVIERQRQVETAGDREPATSDAEAPDAQVVASLREAVSAIEAEDSVVTAFRRAVQAVADARHEHARLLTTVGLPAHTRLGTLPSRESVMGARDDITACDDAIRTARRELDGLDRRSTDIQRQLSDDELHHVPDPAEVTVARAARDDLITEVVRAWLAGEPPARAPGLPVEVERAVREADRVGDLLAEHAEVAARRGVLTAELAKTRAEAIVAGSKVAEAERACTAARQAWEAIWAPVGVPHPPVTDALVFHESLAGALVAEGRAVTATRTAEDLRPAVEERRHYLADVVARAGRPRPEADLDSLLEAARHLLDEDDDAREARAVARKVRAIRQEAERELERARTRRNESADRWRTTLATAHLPDLSPTGWYRRRDIVTRARTSHVTATGLRERARQLAERHCGFVDELAALTARLGVEGDHVTDVLDTLSARVQAAMQAKGTADNLVRRLDSLRRKLEEHIEQRRLAIAVLDDLRQRTDAVDLDAAAERGEELAGLLTDVDQHSEVVRTAVPRTDPRQLVAELSDVDEEQLRIDADTAGRRYEDADKAHEEALRRYGELSQRHQALITRPGAAELHAKAHERLAVLADEVEEYLVAEIQRTVLRDELEAYEREHSSPLLETAGRILEELTGGRYVALHTHSDANGRSLRIVGTDERPRKPDELSEGTADQAFLALRLAGIESLQDDRRTRGLPTLPVVLDDVLMTFDDARAAATLKVMARLARRWQIVVFSHHTHLRQVAEGLESDNLTIAELDAPSSIDSTRTPQEIRDAARERIVIGNHTEPAPRATKTVDPTLVRAWARRTGRQVGDRGRISQDVIDAYEAAHS